MRHRSASKQRSYADAVREIPVVKTVNESGQPCLPYAVPRQMPSKRKRRERKARRKSPKVPEGGASQLPRKSPEMEPHVASAVPQQFRAMVHSARMHGGNCQCQALSSALEKYQCRLKTGRGAQLTLLEQCEVNAYHWASVKPPEPEGVPTMIVRARGRPIPAVPGAYRLERPSAEVGWVAPGLGERQLPHQDRVELLSEVASEVMGIDQPILVRQVDVKEEGGNPHRIEDHEMADLEVRLVPHKMPNLSFIGHYNSTVATGVQQYVQHLGAHFRSASSDVMLPASIVDSLKVHWVDRVRDGAGKEFSVAVAKVRKLAGQVRLDSATHYRTVRCAPTIAYLESSREQQIVARLWQQAHLSDLLGDLTSSWQYTKDAVETQAFKQAFEVLCSCFAFVLFLFCMVLLASLCCPIQPETPWWDGFLPRGWGVDPIGHQSWLARWLLNQWGFSKGYVASDIVYMLFGGWVHSLLYLRDVTVAFGYYSMSQFAGFLGACAINASDPILALLA